MPRQPSFKPTNIYLIFDTRPETVAVHGTQGEAFYCGKTVGVPAYRLNRHKADALKNPENRHSAMMLKCGDDVALHVIEVVPADEDWAARERYHIARVRSMNPNCTNTSAGGFGMPGVIPSAETRAKLSAAKKGRKLPLWQVELLRNIHLGSKHTPEQIEKTASKHRGQKRPPETGPRISAANKGKIITVEAREKMRLAKLGKKQKPEHVENMRKAITGKPKSESHRAALKAAWVLRRGREAIKACHGVNVFDQIGVTA